MQENISLKEEIKDIKENLNINKDIIASMFKDMKDKKKISYSDILQKLTQENVSIYKQIDKISLERNKLRNELIQIKEEKSSGQEQLVQENTKLKTKLFLLEQKLIKTKNLYEITKKRAEKKNSKNFKNNEFNNIRSKSQNSSKKSNKNNFTNPTNPNERTTNYNNINKKIFENIIEKKKNDNQDDNNEVYILDPSKALLKLNDELLFYKESHQKFLAKLKKKQETIIKYENMINKLNTENSELKKTYKLKLLKVNNEKENILSIIVQNNLNIDEQSNSDSNNKNQKNINLAKSKISSGLSLTTTDNNDNSSNNYNNNTNHTLEQLNLNYSQLKKIINKDDVIGKETTLEEFGAILKNVGLTRELFEKMSQIKGFGKLTDSIEFFYKLCLEKNKQILILEKENESLVFKNYELNKLNIELENELKVYKNNCENDKNNLNINNIKKILDDDSIINNQSQNANNNIINSNINNNTNTNTTNNNTNNTNNTNNNNTNNIENLNINSTINTMNNNMNNNILNYKKLLEKQKEEGQLKKAEIIFNLSLERENESSSSMKNDNNDAEIMDNEEKENDDNDFDNNQLYSDSKSFDDIQFKESYNENTNSNIDSIMSKDFNQKFSEDNQNE